MSWTRLGLSPPSRVALSRVSSETSRGRRVGGALVSALGATTAFTKTDRSGRFELASLISRPLPRPGAPERIRCVARSDGRSDGEQPRDLDAVTASCHGSLQLRRLLACLPLASGWRPSLRNPSPLPQSEQEAKPTSNSRTSEDDHGEVAWRLRHVRRGVLQEASGVVTDQSFGAEPEVLTPAFDLVERPRPRRAWRPTSLRRCRCPVSSIFLTTSSSDSPQQLFSMNNPRAASPIYR